VLDLLYNLVITPLTYLIEIIFSISYRFLGSAGPSIIVVSIVVNILILPLYQTADRLQMEERDRQQAMSRWVNHIKKHFKGDEQYMLLSTYYRQQNYKPIYALRSSISLLLQIPFFIAAYRYLSGLEILKGASFLGISNLGMPDQLISIGGLTLNLLPILMTALNLVSGAIYTRGFPLKDKAQTYGLALLFLFLLYDRPSGLVLYWTCNQVFSLVKNIFTRLVPNPRKTLVFLLQGLLAALFFYAYSSNMLHSPKRVILLVVLAVAAEGAVLHRPANDARANEEAYTTRLFLAGCLVLTVLIGVLVPSSFIGSSPTEFIDTSTYASPLRFILTTTSISAGVFLLWLGTFYYLSPTSTRQGMAFVIVALAGCCLVNYYFFGGNLGVITTSLVFESAPHYSKTEILVNMAALAVTALALILATRFAPKLLVPSLVILSVAIFGSSMPNLLNIKAAEEGVIELIEDLSDEGVSQDDYFNADGSVIPTIHLSKSGKNVVVLFLDRGISGFLPFMLEERPDLAEKLAGFTYYPNTISFGGSTVFGSPALMGGYEYSVEAMNARADELLVDKHNESVQVLPAIFDGIGFNSTLFSPPMIDYAPVARDFSIFSQYNNVEAYYDIGMYNDVAFPKMSHTVDANFKRNLFVYSLFKCAPVVLQPTMYDDGLYWSTLVNHSVNTDFLDNYSTLIELPELTAFDGNSAGSYFMLHSEATHTPDLLQLPSYEPALFISDYGQDVSTYSLNGRTLVTDIPVRRAHYQSFVCTLQRLCVWFDYLKEQGVWDNTRIIIVSDHGHHLFQFDYMVYDDVLDIQLVNPLFMVKDFNSSGDIQTSNEFMTNADTVWMALDGIVDNPVNPFTGNPINDDAKSHPQLITTSYQWNTKEYQQGTTFDTDDGHFYTVHDDIFNFDNWERLD